MSKGIIKTFDINAPQIFDIRRNYISNVILEYKGVEILYCQEKPILLRDGEDIYRLIDSTTFITRKMMKHIREFCNIGFIIYRKDVLEFPLAKIGKASYKSEFKLKIEKGIKLQKIIDFFGRFKINCAAFKDGKSFYMGGQRSFIHLFSFNYKGDPTAVLYGDYRGYDPVTAFVYNEAKNMILVYGIDGKLLYEDNPCFSPPFQLKNVEKRYSLKDLLCITTK